MRQLRWVRRAAPWPSFLSRFNCPQPWCGHAATATLTARRPPPAAGDPPSYARWGIQLAEWVACVVAARALCGTLVVLLGPALVHVAQVQGTASL